MNARPKIDAPSWNIVLAIVLSLLAAQSAYYNFNSTTTSDIAVLKQQVGDLRRDVQELRARDRRPNE